MSIACRRQDARPPPDPHYKVARLFCDGKPKNDRYIGTHGKKLVAVVQQ